MQITTVSKSKFKAKALEYFRIIQETGQPMLVTHNDKPVIKISSFKEGGDVNLKALFGSVLKYDNPMDPVGLEDWEVLK
jgi:hypothetical protein